MVWRMARQTVLLVTLILIGALIWYPAQTLPWFWNVGIPSLPLVFLISPILWRNVCPLASLNMLFNGKRMSKKIGRNSLDQVSLVGMGLLVLLVPARRFVFNESGPALALVIVLVGASALILGAHYVVKAGFCNSICPVLPVEKLYGQFALFQQQSPRCAACSLCTAKGCLDISPKKSFTVPMGHRARTRDWLKTTNGIFAATFPGFILGYFMLDNGTLADAPFIYATIAVYAILSYYIVYNIVFFYHLEARDSLPFLAAASAILYYWFALPSMLAFLGVPASSIVLFRSVFLGFMGFWLGRAMVKSVTPRQYQRTTTSTSVARTSSPG